MKTISAINDNGVMRPSEPIPESAVQVVMTGTEYVVYEAGDALPGEPPTPLADLQAQAWENIQAKREQFKYEGGVKVGSNWFSSDKDSIGLYNSLVNIAARNALPDAYVMRAQWRTMVDGVVQDMTPALAGQILAAGLAQFAAIDDAAQTHKAAMLASADPVAYDFSGGWPPVFGD